MMPLLVILAVSLLASIIVSLVYKYTTDQKEMKQLRAETESYQKKLREIKDPQQAVVVQKQAMDVSMKYSMKSMRPTLFTLIPMLLIFSWLNQTVAYEPLLPNQPFTATANFDPAITGTVALSASPEGLAIKESSVPIQNGKAEFTLMGKAGTYTLDFQLDNISFSREALVSTEKYLVPSQIMKSSDIKATGFATVDAKSVKKIDLGNKPVRPLGDITLFGYAPGWLAVYILSSLVFSMLFRKAFNLY